VKLSTEDISVRYNGINALDGVSIGIDARELVAIIGPNGSGKSTLLRTMARLLKPESGAVKLDGQDVRRMKSDAVARKVAILPQIHTDGLDLTVEELVWRGRYPHQGMLQWATGADREAVSWALGETDLRSIAGRKLASLSGGERQRAWIALTLAQQPEILLMDEPTSFLDIQHQVEVMHLLRRLNEEGMTIVTVLHDLALAGRFANRIVALRDGRLAMDGTPAATLTPEHLEDVFGVPMAVLADPDTGLPIPIPRVGPDCPVPRIASDEASSQMAQALD
jgi:ABC-type cobalamin/Fe3+-siderophores transport system ATPase subunit